MIGHLGHFCLDFFGQIWTQGTLRHILGSILVIFEICHFLAISLPFEYRKWVVSVNQSFLDEGTIITPLLVQFEEERSLG